MTSTSQDLFGAPAGALAANPASSAPNSSPARGFASMTSSTVLSGGATVATKKFTSAFHDPELLSKIQAEGEKSALEGDEETTAGAVGGGSKTGKAQKFKCRFTSIYIDDDMVKEWVQYVTSSFADYALRQCTSADRIKVLDAAYKLDGKTESNFNWLSHTSMSSGVKNQKQTSKEEMSQTIFDFYTSVRNSQDKEADYFATIREDLPAKLVPSVKKMVDSWIQDHILSPKLTEDEIWPYIFRDSTHATHAKKPKDFYDLPRAVEMWRNRAQSFIGLFQMYTMLMTAALLFYDNARYTRCSTWQLVDALFVPEFNGKAKPLHKLLELLFQSKVFRTLGLTEEEQKNDLRLLSEESVYPIFQANKRSGISAFHRLSFCQLPKYTKKISTNPGMKALSDLSAKAPLRVAGLPEEDPLQEKADETEAAAAAGYPTTRPAGHSSKQDRWRHGKKTETAGVAEIAKKVINLAKDPEDSSGGRQKLAFKTLSSSIVQTALDDDKLTSTEKVSIGLVGSIIEHIPALLKATHKTYHSRATSNGSTTMTAHELLEAAKASCPDIAALAKDLEKPTKKSKGPATTSSAAKKTEPKGKKASSKANPPPTRRCKRGRGDEEEEEGVLAFLDREAEEDGGSENWTDQDDDDLDDEGEEEDSDEESDEASSSDDDQSSSDGEAEGDAFPPQMGTEECLEQAGETTIHWRDIHKKLKGNAKAAATYQISNPDKCPALPPGAGKRVKKYCCDACFKEHGSFVQQLIEERAQLSKSKSTKSTKKK